MKVLTYNIHSCIGTDGQLDVGRIAEVIRQSGADIVGLNEADCRFHKRSDFADQPQILADQLEMHVCFAPGINMKGWFGKKGGFGNVLLSRYPILKSETIPLIGWTNGEEPRSLLKASVETEEGIVNVGVTHLGLKEQSRMKQVDKILSCMESDMPTIIMGDFNAKPDEQACVEMRRHYIDNWEMAGEGNGFTFSSTNPKARIDYIYTSVHLDIEKTQVWEQANGASDHLPLLSNLKVKSANHNPAIHISYSAREDN